MPRKHPERPLLPQLATHMAALSVAAKRTRTNSEMCPTAGRILNLLERYMPNATEGEVIIVAFQLASIVTDWIYYTGQHPRINRTLLEVALERIRNADTHMGLQWSLSPKRAA